MKDKLIRFGIACTIMAGIFVTVVAARMVYGDIDAQAAVGMGAMDLTPQQMIIAGDFTDEAAACIECHAKVTPGIVVSWQKGKMGHLSISCYDCHVVEADSPMASQCEGVEGTETYTSPMVSSAVCEACHPVEVKQFLLSGHAYMAARPLVDNKKLAGLMYHNEGGEFIGVEWGSPTNIASRSTGCQVCHGTIVELDENNMPINGTWPGGVGTRYPDGAIGNCTVCHTRHEFSMAEARKPEACASCHLGPDHPDIEIYLESKHGQVFLTQGEEWNWEAPTDEWGPGDYTAPTCAVCHMSGIGDLESTHNVNERLKWDLMHKKSVIRSGERGDGEKGDKLMRQVCSNCHSTLHTNIQRDALDSAVDLYNTYWDDAVRMKEELAAEGLLGDDPWTDGFQELMYYLWHHTGRRARQGAAMNAPDYAHWHGFFQMFQVLKDMQAIYDYRMKTGAIEELSTVMSTGPI